MRFHNKIFIRNMEQIKNKFESLNDNQKRCITLILSSFMSYFIFFPLNILVVYLVIQGYQKNRENILLGIFNELKILWKIAINFRDKNSSTSEPFDTKKENSDFEGENSDFESKKIVEDDIEIKED